MRSSTERERSVLIRVISRASGECSAASWATTARASPERRPRGPARPSADLPQTRGHRHRGQQTGAVGRAPVRRAEPHRERLRVSRAALPQPGPRSERGQQQRGGIGPPLGSGRARDDGLRGRRVATGPLRVVVRPRRASGVRLVARARRSAAGPFGEPAALAHTRGTGVPRRGVPFRPLPAEASSAASS